MNILYIISLISISIVSLITAYIRFRDDILPKIQSITYPLTTYTKYSLSCDEFDQFCDGCKLLSECDFENEYGVKVKEVAKYSQDLVIQFDNYSITASNSYSIKRIIISINNSLELNHQTLYTIYKPNLPHLRATISYEPIVKQIDKTQLNKLNDCIFKNIYDVIDCKHIDDYNKNNYKLKLINQAINTILEQGDNNDN